MSNVSTGDLAYIIRIGDVDNPYLRKNIGRIVEVGEAALHPDTSAVGWMCTVQGEPGYSHDGRRIASGFMEDRNLRKIAGPDIDIGTDVSTPKKIRENV